MKIALANFQGEIPILDARLLPESNAQVARNVYLKRGTLKPHNGISAVQSLPGVTNPANLYHYDQGNDGDGFWFSWGDQYDVDVVRSPIADDAYGRVYWTGQGAPKMSAIDMATAGSGPYPSSWYALGVPAPDSAPVASEPSTRAEPDPITNEDGDTVEIPEFPPSTALQTAYVVTLVTEFGEEGPPSDPSNFLLRWDNVEGNPAGGEVVVDLPGVPTGAQNIVSKRLYRVESGQYQRVADIPAATGSYTDEVPSQGLGVSLRSLYWDAPNPEMTGLTLLPNGVLTGFFGSTLAFSEAYLPHAWPTGYQLAFDDPVVAIAAISGGLVVATTGQPWLVTGSSPAAMAQMKLDVNQPCAAKRSMVDMGGFAIYASYDGLVAAGGSDARVVTREVLSKEQWLALKPETIRAFRYDGAYLAFYEGGAFLFTPGQGIEFFDYEASAGYYDVTRDTLYLIIGNGIYAWDKGAPLTLTWRSKLFEFPPGSAGFSCAKVIAYGYPVRLRVIADGSPVIEHDAAGPDMFRLPAGFTLCREWELEVISDHEVTSVQIATSPGELI